MVTKKIGVIGCGNMGGAILYGALESGVLAKENVYVYDINPAMMGCLIVNAQRATQSV